MCQVAMSKRKTTLKQAVAFLRFMNELNDGADEEGSVGDLYTGNFDSDSCSSLPNHAAHSTSSIASELVTTRAASNNAPKRLLRATGE